MKKKDQKKIKTLFLFVLLVSTISVLAGCIEPPTKLETMEEIDMSPEKLASILGMNSTLVEEYINDFDVHFYGSNYSSIYDPYYEYTWNYRDWSEEYDDVVIDDYGTIARLLVYRRLMTMHAIALVNGSLVEYETGYNTVLITSHGDVSDYEELIDAIEETI